jgi:hypothetical protein
MRTLLWLVLSLFLLDAPLLGQADGALAREVLAAADRRFAAMLRADTAALGPLLAPDLTYVHTTGRVDSKQSFLQLLGAGTLRYASIDPEERTVRLYDNTAVELGRSAMRAGPPDRLQAFRIRYLAVYRHHEGAWRLVAWQSTRLPE